MNPTFDRLYRQLGRATVGLLLSTLVCYGITRLCELLGLSQAEISFRGVVESLAYVSVALSSLFLVAFVVVAVIRWVGRRSQIKGSTPV